MRFSLVRLALPLLLLRALSLPAVEEGPEREGERPPLLAPLSDAARVPLPELDPAVPAPQEALGRPLGSRFTHQAAQVAYLEKLAAASERVAIWDYGESYEGRPLKLLAISSADNLARLEELRRRHLRLAAPALLPPAEREALTHTQPAFVWLAYGIHGNEASSAEAAMVTAYTLAAAGGEWEDRLREVVVLIDPLSNPDGRERYVGAYEQRRGRLPDPDAAAAEHDEPWPGGRTNHYWVDLNRDWAWATQQETRFRIAAYRRWEPQVYADFHEMKSSSTYFFPPPSQPVHPAIDRKVLAWLETFGQANAEPFDRLGWVFFKSERYDLFYPGYSDSYAGLRGAVGMTYEVGGGGRAGEALELADGRLFTLADRIARHLVVSLATVRTAAENRVALLSDFAAVRRAASTHLPQSILWEADQPEAWALAELLSLHGIEVHRLAADVELSARPGQGGEERRRTFPRGGFVVSTAQPLAGLVEALLKVESPLPPEFVERQRWRIQEGLPAELYDLTAWSLPLAFNLETWLVYGEPAALAPLAPPARGITGEGEVGFLVPPGGLASYRIAAGLRREGLHHRLALASFRVGGRSYPRGTLFIPRRGNSEALAERLAALAQEVGVEVHRVATSFTDQGISLGSDDMVAVRPGRIALVTGEGVDPASAGSLWHLLDRQVELPHSRLELVGVLRALPEIDVLLLPSGSGYRQRLGDEGAAALRRWVEAGGVLVAVGEAARWLQQVGLVPFGAPGGDSAAGAVAAERGEEGPRLVPALYTPGAALATEMRQAHPLTAGLPSSPSVLFLGDQTFALSAAAGENLLRAASDRPVLSGLAWPEAEERLAGTLLVGERRLGEGRVVAFAQEPAFRCFWRGTMPLLLNAALYGPSWPR